MNLINLFKDFHKQAIVNKYPTNVRGVFDSILYDFNAVYFPEHCIYTQRELSALTGLSLEPLHRALKFLAERGHITVRASKKGTVIRLCECQTQAKQEPNISQTRTKHTEQIPIIRAREDIKTKDIKTKNNNISAGACESEMDVYDLWEHETGYALTGSTAYELESLEKTYGREAFHSALVQAVQSNSYTRVSFKYFKAILENLDNPKPTKGGEKVESTAPSYEKPIRTGDEPWLKY